MKNLILILTLVTLNCLAAEGDGSSNEPVVSTSESPSDFILLCTQAEGDGSSNDPSECSLVLLSNPSDS